MGKDAGTDEVVEAAVVTLKKLGAVVIDPIKYPDYILQSKQALYNIVTYAEFKAQIADYLKTSEPRYPKTLDEIVARANDPKTAYRSPEKAVALKYTAFVALDLSDPSYIAAKNEALASTRAAVMALFAKYQLDAIVYPTSPRPAQYQARWPSGTFKLADEPCQRERLSGFDCARWHDVVGSARNDFVLRAGVQRREAARLRLRLRAGNQSAGVAQAHARAPERCARGGFSAGNAVSTRRVAGFAFTVLKFHPVPEESATVVLVERTAVGGAQSQADGLLVFFQMSNRGRAGDGQHHGSSRQQPAIATWAGVASWRAATSAIAPLTRAASLPADSGNHGMKAMPSRSHSESTGSEDRSVTL